MPKYSKDTGLGEQVVALTDRVAALERRSPGIFDAGGLFAVSYRGLVYEDASTWTTYFQAAVRPRMQLDLGLIFLGDQVTVGSATTDTGGAWRVQVGGTPVDGASGTVPADFTFHTAAVLLDLSSYPPDTPLLIEVQAERTSGAITGGRYGNGGAVGLGIRWATFS